MGSERLDLVALVAAFATSEGYFVTNSVPARLNNPTDLRYAGQEGSKPSQYGGPIPFAEFDRPERGIAAALRQMAKLIQEGYTLRAIVNRWAPDSDGNNSKLYLSETVRRMKAATGLEIDPDRKLWDYLPISEIK